MALKIRNATHKDLEAIFQVEKRSYPPELQAPHKVLEERFEVFGIRIAELDEDIVGFYTCVPVHFDWGNHKKIITDITANRNPHYSHWFEQYGKKGTFNTLLVTSTAVSSEHQHKHIGKRLVIHSLKLAEKQGLEYRASVLRVPVFRVYTKKGMDIHTYLEAVKEGEISNPTLNLYISLGFILETPIQKYEPDRTSADYGIFAFKKS